jgi:hypothetical protein
VGELGGVGEAARDVLQPRRHAEGAVGEGVLDQGTHGSQLSRVRGTRLVAHDLGPDGAGGCEVPDVQCGALVVVGQQVGDGAAGGQVLGAGAVDGAEVAGDRLDGPCRGGREGDAVLAQQQRRHALAQAGFLHLEVVRAAVRVHVGVHEPGRDVAAGDVDPVSGLEVPQPPEGADRAAGDRHVGAEGRSARAVDDPPTLQQHVAAHERPFRPSGTVLRRIPGGLVGGVDRCRVWH